MKDTKDARNQKIYFAFISGQSIETLAFSFKLSAPRVRAILDEIRLKIAVSPNPIYRRLRQNLSS